MAEKIRRHQTHKQYNSVRKRVQISSFAKFLNFKFWNPTWFKSFLKLKNFLGFFFFKIRSDSIRIHLLFLNWDSTVSGFWTFYMSCNFNRKQIFIKNLKHFFFNCYLILYTQNFKEESVLCTVKKKGSLWL